MLIDTMKFVRSVRTLASRHPGRTAACNYLASEDGLPCIIGESLTEDFGVPQSFFEKTINEDSGYIFNDVGVAELFDNDNGLTLSINDPDTIDWLIKVQETQDEGIGWSLAVRKADELFGPPEDRLVKETK